MRRSGHPARLMTLALLAVLLGSTAPIGALALYNRRVLEALRRVPRPNVPTMRLVRRLAASELALGLAVVVIASLLVAQVPGGT